MVGNPEYTPASRATGQSIQERAQHNSALDTARQLCIMSRFGITQMNGRVCAHDVGEWLRGGSGMHARAEERVLYEAIQEALHPHAGSWT